LERDEREESGVREGEVPYRRLGRRLDLEAGALECLDVELHLARLPRSPWPQLAAGARLEDLLGFPPLRLGVVRFDLLLLAEPR
jgi:hypothetical protein